MAVLFWVKLAVDPVTDIPVNSQVTRDRNCYDQQAMLGVVQPHGRIITGHSWNPGIQLQESINWMLLTFMFLSNNFATVYPL